MPAQTKTKISSWKDLGELLHGVDNGTHDPFGEAKVADIGAGIRRVSIVFDLIPSVAGSQEYTAKDEDLPF